MPRILYVTSRLPYPPREGHQLRSWHLLRAAASRYSIDLLSLQRPQDPEVPDRTLTDLVDSFHAVRLPTLSSPPAALAMAGRWLRDRQPLLVARYVSGELRESFRERLEHADLVHIDILPLAGLMPLVPSRTPIVLNEHNVESRLLRSRARIEARSWHQALMQQQIPVLTRFERSACHAADRVLACSQPDAERLRELAPEADVRVVPNGVDLDYFYGPNPQAEGDRTLVFVGQMSWFPNRDGVENFLQQALPRILEREPASRLRVIGRHDGLQVPAALHNAVKFTGFVNDIRPLVHEAAVYVLPLRAGSGTRLKLLEAMAMGKAIVSTTIGAEGIDLRDGENGLLADDPDSFASAVCRLMADRNLRQRLGSAARRTAEQQYGWTAIGRRLLDVYDELLPSGWRAHQSSGRATPAPASRLPHRVVVRAQHRPTPLPPGP